MTQIDPPFQEPAEGGWTERRVRTLIGLWNQRLSAARIARALGPGVSRSAVVGKLMRLGLKRTDEQRHDAQVVGARLTRGRTGPPPLPTAPLPAPSPCSVVPLLLEITALGRHACRWPYETEAGTRFCGHSAPGRGPYCPGHHIIAYCDVLPPLTLETLNAEAPRLSP